MRTLIITGFLACGFLLAEAGMSLSGNIDSPSAPAAGSGMPTTSDIYNQLNTGANSNPAGSFQEPASGSGSSGRTLLEIQGKLPAQDNTNGATPADVIGGKTYFGVRTDGTWGQRSGSLPQQTLNPYTTIVSAGVYNATTLDSVEFDLLPSNIIENVDIFGVIGTAVNLCPVLPTYKASCISRCAFYFTIQEQDSCSSACSSFSANLESLCHP